MAFENLIYANLKRKITEVTNKFQNGEISPYEYEAFRELNLKKMDTFLTCNRITPEHYKELYGIFIPTNGADVTDEDFIREVTEVYND